MDLYIDIKKKFKDFFLEIKFQGSNEIIGLLGSSGSGKSMTLRCISGIITPDEGVIVVDGREFFNSKKGINLKPRERNVGFLFQNYALFPHLTIKENISFGIKNLTNEKKNEKVVQLMEKFHILELENRYPFQVSGGQQQRIALARAIATEPQILLLDEPFSALDEYLRAHMIKEMLDFLRDFNGITVFVTHNMEEAYRICDNLAILCSGKLVTYGEKDDVFRDPKTSEAAKITGCKNIVRAYKKAKEFIEIPCWDLKLKTDQNLKTDLSLNSDEGYCGIRANHIELASKTSDENVFEARIIDIIETPFRKTIYMLFEKPFSSKTKFHIQWEVGKNLYNFRKGEVIKIFLPKNKIMFFEK